MWKQPTSAWDNPWQKAPRSKAEPPISGSCSMAWILPDALAFGSLPLPGDSFRFHALGIRSILTLCEAIEGTLPSDIPQQFIWQRLTLPDSRYSHHPDVPQMARVAHYIHTQISQNSPIYVHCFAGIERSPAACIAYLCQYHKLELWEAIHQVKQVRPQVVLSDLQLHTLRQLIPL